MVAVLALLVGIGAADSTQFIVVNHGRPAGEMRIVSAGDSVVVRFQYQDRQRGPRIESRYWVGAGGRVRAMETRSFSPEGTLGPVNEHVDYLADSVRLIAGTDTTTMRGGADAFYRLRSTSPYDEALLARHLIARPQRSSRVLPEGSARAEVVADTTVTVAGAPRRIRLVLIDGLSTSTGSVWLDDADGFFASGAGWFVTVPRGAEGLLPALREIEKRHRAARSEALAKRLAPPPTRALVIRNGDVFDSDRGVVRPRMTVVIEGDRFTRIGPTDSVRTIPPGATVIDATGKTLIPGLWDMHTHALLQSEESGLLELAAGITSVRDVAADIDVAVSHRDRARAGTMLSPRIILAGFMEGPGRWAGPSEVLVRTEDEARAWVARYDSLGYKQIKVYNLLHPDLIPTIAEEAHKRGMRLSGHIPRGLSVQAAVRLGFDEIQHAAYLFSTFFQDSLYVPRMRAYSEIASNVAPTFDVDAPQVTELISFLRDRGTVVDGTFNIWQDRTALADGNDPVFGPTVAWLPPITRRSFAAGSPGSPQAAARAQAGSANYRRMLKRLYDSGVTIVPGTDNLPGLSLHGELEVYERAGIPASAVLQIATIIPARVMKDDKDYGSIKLGKIADLAIVNGRPAERITDLRRTEKVIRAGRLYDSKALYEAAGLTPK